MQNTLGVGIIGCGNISSAYLRLAPLFRGIEMRACADIDPAASARQAKAFGVRAETVDNLLKAKDIDIIVNLTIPAAHFGVAKKILSAGKHVYSEKPFVLSVRQGKELTALAAKKRRRIGSAPDTFLGGSHQLARHLIDSGKLGTITSGTCHVMSHGMEHWHPNPDFFYQPGGGPVLDIGPYYVTNLLQLLGPVSNVIARSSTPQKTRTISSKPRRGQTLKVETPTTIHAILEFASGALITLGTSWDVWQHKHTNMELYGAEGTIHVPDPNFFGGAVEITKAAKPVARLPKWDHPFAVNNQESSRGPVANYRTAGLAEMALAILGKRPHRCANDLALHAVDVMTAILKSGESGRRVNLQTTCKRPAALSPRDARALLKPVRGKT
ncbi:MAG: Gfo/Idh/MocA family oxidoreductase [Rhodospirillales bacterium]|nr:Gfo/Idh/MocA family oxidoreductase [Rhodospirillales bacterium]